MENKSNIDVNVRFGKILRGWSAYEGYKYFHPESSITERDYYEAVSVFVRGKGDFSVLQTNEVMPNKASGDSSFAEGAGNTSSGKYSHTEGNNNSAKGNCAHAEGYNNTSSGNNSHTEGADNIAEGACAHAEGARGSATGSNSHTEGDGGIASGEASHAEGIGCTASGRVSHAQGQRTTALGNVSHSEGQDTIAEGQFSHAEGQGTKASGKASHTEGTGTTAEGAYSHAGGQNSTAKGIASFVHGTGLVANNKDETVFGKNNTPDVSGKSVFQIGTGTASNPQTAFQVNDDGTISFLGFDSHNRVLQSTANAFFIDLIEEGVTGNLTNEQFEQLQKADSVVINNNGSTRYVSSFISTFAAGTIIQIVALTNLHAMIIDVVKTASGATYTFSYIPLSRYLRILPDGYTLVEPKGEPQKFDDESMTSVVCMPNTDYVIYGDVYTLIGFTVDFNITSEIYNTYNLLLVCASSVPQINFLKEIGWANGKAPELEAGYCYEMSFKRFGVLGDFLLGTYTKYAI